MYENIISKKPTTGKNQSYLKLIFLIKHRVPNFGVAHLDENLLHGHSRLSFINTSEFLINLYIL